MKYHLTYMIGDNDLIYEDELNIDYDIYSYFSQKTNFPYSEFIITIKNGQILNRESKFSKILNQKNGNIIFKIQNIYSILNSVKEVAQFQMVIKQLEERINKYEEQISNLVLQLSKHEVSLDTTMECSNIQIIQQDKDQQQSKEIQNLVVSYYPLKEKHLQQLDNLINQKDQELGVLKKIRVSFINQSYIDSSSELIEMKSDCHYCNLTIQGEKLQTRCQHNYHIDCFDTLVQSQVFQKCQKLTCICNTQLKFECMKNFLQDFRKYYAYKEQFLNNQIIKLKKKNSQYIQSCQNKGCYFFVWKKQDQQQIDNNFFCPLCQE